MSFELRETVRERERVKRDGKENGISKYLSYVIWMVSREGGRGGAI